eukprot:161255_1
MKAIHLTKRARITNSDAVRKLKHLESQYNQKTTNEQLINEAYNIYSHIYKPTNYYVINTLLNMSLNYKQPNRIHSIWNDISKAITEQNTTNQTDISYSLLLKCCIESENITKCIQVLLWIEKSNYKLKIHDLFIRKLLSVCDNLQQIQYIERLLNEKFIENNDKYIKSALITAYGRFNSIKHARNAFDSTINSEKDTHIITAMMKTYMDNNLDTQALDLYKSIKHNDDVSNMLALKTCINVNNLQYGYSIMDTINLNQNSDIQLINTIIDFYGICLDLDKALKVFNSIDDRKKTIFTFNAMMTAYINNKCNKEALDLFDKITLTKDDRTYLLAIKLCSNINDYDKGKSIVAQIDNKCLEQSIQLKTVLIHFYGNCNDVENAKLVFDSINDTHKNTVNISAMMNVYISNEYEEDALELYDALNKEQYMDHDDFAHILALKACTKTMNFSKGKNIHESLQNGNHSIEFMNTLIDFYGKMNCIDIAIEIFMSIDKSLYNVVTIGSMMNAYMNNDHYENALELYDNCALTVLNNVSHMLAIKCCTNSDNYSKGKQIISNSIDIDTVNNQMKTTLIQFYGIFKDISSAQNIFDSVDDVQKNDAIICAMMKAFFNCGKYEEVLNLFNNYGRSNNVAGLLAIKACTYIDTIETFEKGKEIHSNMTIEKHFVHSNIVWNGLIDFYGHFKDKLNVQLISSMDDNLKDTQCTNAIMNAFINCNDNDSALDLYENMNEQNIRSHMLAVRACGNVGKYKKGKQIHECIKDEIKDNIYFKTVLVDFYGNCLDINIAQDIFNSIEQQNIVTIGAMMKAYITNDRNEDALRLYDTLVEPDHTAHLLAIKACAGIQNYEKGKFIHDEIYSDMENCDIQIKTTFIDFYGNCEDIQSAENVFESIDEHQQNIVSIDAMMNAYLVNQMHTECIELFKNIKTFNNIVPDVLAYRLVLSACSKSDQSFEIRQDIHECLKNDIDANWMLEDAIIQSHLIAMYSENGMIQTCEEIFNKYVESNNDRQALVVWNAMLQSYGRNAFLNKAKLLYELIKKHCDLLPDVYTYSILLTACSHCDDMEYAKYIWSHEIEQKDIKYHCIVISNLVDGFARNGYLNEAFEYISKYEKVTSVPYHAMWRALLGGAVKFNNITMAQYVYDEYERRFKNLVNQKNERRISEAALLLANLYASYGEFDTVEQIRTGIKHDLS